MAAQIMPYHERDLTSMPLELQVGYVAVKYRAMIRGRTGSEPDPESPLFPALPKPGEEAKYELGEHSSPAMSDTGWMNWFRRLSVLSKCAPAFTLRLRWHGFRSGGCTDIFHLGRNTYNIIEIIKIQGRWKSNAFRVYIRLLPSTIASVLREVLLEVAQTTQAEGANVVEIGLQGRLVEQLGNFDFPHHEQAIARDDRGLALPARHYARAEPAAPLFVR
jgi:hypothetical protein